MAQTRTRAPHLTPRTAVVWEVLRAETARQAGRAQSVVDVGGGTGGFAVPLAEAGHRVTVVDASPDALAALTRRAEEAGVAARVSPVQGDADRLAELVPAGSADLVLCHSLLEVVDEPAEVVRAVAAVLCPGGAASVLVANRVAAVLTQAMAGHLDTALAALADPAGRAGPADALRRRFGVEPVSGEPVGGEPVSGRVGPASITALLAGAGLVVEQTHGVRVLADLVPAAVAEADPETMLALETRLSAQPPYRDIAAQLHLLACRAPR